MMRLWSPFRSYFIFIPLIFFYTFVLGMLSLACSVGDKRGRIQHNIAHPLELHVGNPIPTAGLTTRDLETLSLRVKQEIERMRLDFEKMDQNADKRLGVAGI
jgi:hypothetical protein